MQILEVNGLRKVYTTRFGGASVEALKNINFSVENGEYVAIMGESGSGKTTLLNILGGMDRLTSGHVLLAGEDVSGFDRKRLTTYRRHEVGFVFQFYNLLPNMTALENVQIAGQLCKDPIPADEVLRQVGLGERMQNFPAQLSGGEQQMLAMGRALMSNASMLMLDEPSMGLSPLLVQEIFDIIRDIHKEGMTILLVEQNAQMALQVANRAYVLETGKITLSGSGKELLESDSIKKAYLGG